MFRLKQIFFTFTKIERMSFLSAAIFAALSGTVLAAMGLIASTEAVPAIGGDYTEGMLGQPAFVNPVLAATETDKGLVRLVFANIYDLAEKIEPSEDKRIWRLRLKEKLFWQDGEKLTSDDVAFTIQKIQESETNSPLFPVWQGVAAQRQSELEIQLSLVNPYAFFENILRGFYPLPKHLFSEVPPANWRFSDFNLRPIGSGPYKFSAFEKRANGFVTVYKLSAWPDYGGEKSLIQNLSFRFFDLPDKLAESFNSGQLDAFASPDPQSLRVVERPHEAVGFKLPNYFAVFFNQGKNLPAKDIGVRMALGYSLDRWALLNKILNGFGRPAFGPIPEGIAYFDPAVTVATSSLEIASSTLQATGWKMGAEGFREKTINKTKVPLAITLSVPKTAMLVKTAEAIQEEWQKIGVKTSLTILAGEELEAAVKNRDYEALLFGNVLSRSPDLFSFWHSSERFYPGLNLALYNNKKADLLIEAIRSNLNDESRIEQFIALQKAILDDYPAVFLLSPDYVLVLSKNIRGIEAGLIYEPAERFTQMKKWYIKTARVLK